MKNFKLLATLLAVIFIMSCERVELPEPSVEGIPFELKGKMGGEDFALGIDQEGMLMNTTTKYIERDSIWEFKGKLNPADGSLGPSLKISFRPEFQGRTLTQSEESVFNIDHWNFYYPQGRPIQRLPLSLQSEFSSNNIRIVDISVHGASNPETTSATIWEFEVGQSSRLPVCVQYEDNRKNTGEFCTHIYPNKNGRVPVVNWGIVSSTDSMATLVARITDHENSNNFKYDWGEGFQEKRMTTVNREGQYRLRIKDQNGLVYSKEKSLLFDDTNNNFYTYNDEISLTVEWGEPRTIKETTQKGSINIEFIDTSGQKWRLADKQNEDAEFKILDRKTYRNNQSGNRTIALMIEFTCQLTNDANETLEADGIKGWFAVGFID